MIRLKKILLFALTFSFLIGIGVVFAAFRISIDETGAKLDSVSSGQYKSNLTSCYIATNNGSHSVFIPLSTYEEILAFDTHHPSYISVATYDQPSSDESSINQCTHGHAVNRDSYDCGIDNYDRCFTRDCKTVCGSESYMYREFGGGACFVAGTKITLADGSKVSIESISTGDVLLGGDGSINRVESLFKIFYKRNVYSINGSDYFVSDSHPFMTTEGWKSFDPVVSLKENPTLAITKLSIGDVLITDHGLEKIVSFDSKLDPQYVYNFEVNGNHTYFANGYLVHNKNPLQQ